LVSGDGEPIQIFPRPFFMKLDDGLEVNCWDFPMNGGKRITNVLKKVSGLNGT
jgi:hypothetical protein